MEENAITAEQGTTPVTEEESTVPEAENAESTGTDTTAEETAGTADESTTSPAESAETEAHEEAEEKPFYLPVKVNHEERELTLDEATKYAQLGLAQEPVFGRMSRIANECGKTLTEMLTDMENSIRDNLYNRLLEEAGGNEEIAKRLLEVEMRERDAAYENTVKSEEKAQADEKDRQKERLAGELQELMTEFPNISSAKDVPKSVYADASKNKRSLLDAYLRYQHAEGRKIREAKASQEAASAASVGSRRDAAPAGDPDPVMQALNRGLRSALG